MKFYSWIKRTWVIGFIVICVVGGSFTAAVPRAQAFLGIGDIVFDPAALAQMVADIATNIARWVAEDLWKVLRDQAVKRIVDSMTDDIVNAINNGGEPLFVSDFGAFLGRSQDLAFDEFNNYLMDSAGISLCAPFQPELKIYFNNNIASGGPNGRYPFGIPARCTFSQFQQNIQNTETFIKSGGWIGLQQLFLPQNNVIGASIALESAYNTKIAQDQLDKTQEYLSGSGFLAVKKCVDPGPGVPDAECKEFETVTPGDVVAQSATKATLKDFEYAANVESVVSALVNVFIKNIFDKGKGLVYGGTTRGGSGSVSSTYSDPNVTTNTLNDQWVVAQKKLFKMDHDLYLLENLLSQNILPKIKEGRKRAMGAIYACYVGVGYYPSTPYGWLRYQVGTNSSNFSTAQLSTLVNVPFTHKTLPPSEPELLSLISRDLVTEAMKHKVWPPVQDMPPQEGYFERTFIEADNALKATQRGRLDIASFLQDLNKVSTSTTIVNASGDTVDNIASATTAINVVVGKASSLYSSFTAQYQTYLSEALAGQDGVTPGTPSYGSGGFSETLTEIINGLVFFSMPHSPVPDPKSFFYCDFRS
ncbi:MAG: hypothetical protein WC099_02115 [Candidatus Paceibacterota bacterium]